MANIVLSRSRLLPPQRTEHLADFRRAKGFRERQEEDRPERRDGRDPANPEREGPDHPVRHELRRHGPDDRAHREARENEPEQRREDRAPAHSAQPLPDKDEEREEVDPEARRRREGDSRVLHRPGERDAEDPEHGEVERADEDWRPRVMQRVERLREDLHARGGEEPQREEPDGERRLCDVRLREPPAPEDDVHNGGRKEHEAYHRGDRDEPDEAEREADRAAVCRPVLLEGLVGKRRQDRPGDRDHETAEDEVRDAPRAEVVRHESVPERGERPGRHEKRELPDAVAIEPGRDLERRALHLRVAERRAGIPCTSLIFPLYFPCTSVPLPQGIWRLLGVSTEPRTGFVSLRLDTIQRKPHFPASVSLLSSERTFVFSHARL